MKTLKKLSSTLFLLLFAGMAMAQDVIVKNDQTTILSKVIEITSAEIKYKKWNNQDGPTYSISRSEVTSINYQNGEVEKFTNSTNDQQNNETSKVQNLNGKMTHNGFHIYLDGRKLSDYEVENLVDAESYQLYQKGRSQNKTGMVLAIIGTTSLIVGAGIGAFNSDLYNTSAPLTQIPAFKTFIALLSVGVASGVVGVSVASVGFGNMSEVVKIYNIKHGNAYSLNISPSLMRCDTPQSQGNYGLGLTLNVNF